MRNDRAGGKPVDRRGLLPARATRTRDVSAVRGRSVIAPVVLYRGGKLGMEREAATRQGIELTAGAPIERQKTAGLAGSRAGNLRSFDDDDIDAAPREKIGGAGS